MVLNSSVLHDPISVTIVTVRSGVTNSDVTSSVHSKEALFDDSGVDCG